MTWELLAWLLGGCILFAVTMAVYRVWTDCPACGGKFRPLTGEERKRIMELLGPGWVLGRGRRCRDCAWLSVRMTKVTRSSRGVY